MITVNPPEAPKIGTIGPPVVDVDVAIDETAADQSAFEDDPGEVGELLVKGPNVTRGYWNKPGATERAFTDEVPGGGSDAAADSDADEPTEPMGADGATAGQWFRTGDIVHKRPDGYLEFRDRTKQILVLSTGKNVAPALIEDQFAASEIIEQAMVVGDNEKFVGALLVPNTDHIRSWADTNDIDLPDDPQAMCDDDRVREYIREDVDRANEEFEDYEQIKRFELVPQEFTEENEMLTPTMKKKRRVIMDRFADRIDHIYDEDR